MVESISDDEQPRYLSLWCDFCSWVWFREVLSFLWSNLVLFFSFTSACLWCPLVCGVCFQYSKVHEIFFFPKCSKVFLILMFYSFHWGLRHFWSRRACANYGPVPCFHNKKVLVLYSRVRWALDKYRDKPGEHYT